MATKRAKKVDPYPPDTPEQAARNAVVKDSFREDYSYKMVVVCKSFLSKHLIGTEVGNKFFDDRRFLAAGGFGCGANKLGRAVYGTFMCDGEQARIDRGDIAGIAVNQSITDVAQAVIDTDNEA